MRKRSRPSFSGTFSEMQLNALEGYRYDNVLFKDQDVCIDEIQKDFFECKFINMVIEGKMHACQFADVVFDHCDLSNCDLSECIFRRCEFVNCRMTGIDLSISSFTDVLFMESQCMYANLNGSGWNRCEWNKTSLTESSIHDVSWKDMIIHECDLSGCEIMHTSLKDVDLRTSAIDGIAVDIADLRGVIVNVQQAVALSQLLEIVIKE